MKKTIFLITLLLSSSTALAETLPNFTNIKPLIGCYKDNTSDRCVDTAQIICTDSIDHNSELYGSVIGSFCDDINYYDHALGLQNWQILKLKQKIKSLQNKLKKIKGN